jgi:hypothetical protein
MNTAEPRTTLVLPPRTAIPSSKPDYEYLTGTADLGCGKGV